MKRNKYISPIVTMWLLATFLSSCGDEISSKDSIYSFPIEKNIEITQEFNINYLAGFVNKFVIKDSTVVIFDTYGNDLINIFDMNSGKKLHSYVKKGRGPGEINHAFQIYTSNNCDSISVVDANNNRLITYLYNSDSTIQDSFIFQPLPARTNLMPNIVLIKDSTFLAMSSKSDKMFRLIEGGKELDSFIDYPISANETTTLGLAYAYQGVFIPNNDKSKFFYASYAADIFQLFKFDKNKLIKTTEYMTYNPIYEDLSNETMVGVTFSKDNLKGFVNATTTDGNIYLLYSGEKMGEQQDDLISQVYVIDWNGKLVCKLHLDSKVSCIYAYNEKLYAIQEVEKGLKLLEYCID